MNKTFNAAVLHIAGKLHPRGWDVSSAAPTSLEALSFAVARSGRFVIWDGENDNTAFGDAEVNIAFRAWHDWAHWRYQLPFTLLGECEAACVQAWQLIDLFGRTDEVQEWVALLFTEVADMAGYLEETGTHVPDQAAFVLANVQHYRQLAELFLSASETPTLDHARRFKGKLLAWTLMLAHGCNREGA